MKHFKNKAKRIFAAMLCLCMLASVLPMGASAANAVSVDFTSATTTPAYGKHSNTEAKQFSGYFQIWTKNLDRWAAFDLGAIDAGDYNAVLTHYTRDNLAGKFDAYLVPIDGALTESATLNSIHYMVTDDETYKIGTVEFCKSYNNAAITEFKVADLAAGNYKLVLKLVEHFNDAADGSAYSYGYLTGFTMEKTEFNDRVNISFASADKTPVWGKHTDAEAQQYNGYFQVWSEYVGKWTAFDIGGLSAGDYKASLSHYTRTELGGKFDVYLVPIDGALTESATLNTIHSMVTRSDEAYRIGTANFGGSHTNDAVSSFEISGLADGNYKLVLKLVEHALNGEEGNSQKCSYSYITAFTMVPANEAEEEEEPKVDIPADANGNFGNVYAYVKDSKVYFIGGLNNINGSEVGFDVSVAGGESFEMTTDKVYKSFTVTTKDGDVTKNAEHFGVDAQDGYIFITETDKLAAGNEVTIKPYIVKNGVKVYHGTLELKLTI